jgi:fatty acid-binding protein DegV
MKLTEAAVAEAIRKARAAELLLSDPALASALEAYQVEQVRQMLLPGASPEDVLAARQRCIVAEDVIQDLQQAIINARLLTKG